MKLGTIFSVKEGMILDGKDSPTIHCVITSSNRFQITTIKHEMSLKTGILFSFYSFDQIYKKVVPSAWENINGTVILKDGKLDQFNIEWNNDFYIKYFFKNEDFKDLFDIEGIFLTDQPTKRPKNNGSSLYCLICKRSTRILNTGIPGSDMRYCDHCNL